MTSLRLAGAALNPATVDRLLGSETAAAFVTRTDEGRSTLSSEVLGRIAVSEKERVAELDDTNSRFVTAADPAFPIGLDPMTPRVRWLYLRGSNPRPGVAVIGSRRCTTYGRRIARVIGMAVAHAGRSLISGLAAGIDGEAHRGALEGQGHTTAVLGSGIDVWYPRSHRGLGEEILATGGTVVSEFPPGTSPEPWRFPARNRIIAGLSEAVIVVEAAERSGALITARLALEAGREVFAVPGDLERPTSAGCNRLIADGAHPIVDLGELSEMLGWVRATQVQQGSILGESPIDLETAVADAGLSAVEVLRRLGHAELEPVGLGSVGLGFGGLGFGGLGTPPSREAAG